MEFHTTHLQAADPLAPPEKLRKLLRSGEFQVRLRLAENEASPPDLLRKLAKDSHPEVRASVANNPSTTCNTLKSLSVDNHDDVRFAMASNPQLPLEILRNFSQDSNPYISDRIHKTIDSLSLELDLEQQGFVSVPGAHARLGELLVASGIIEEKEIYATIACAKSAKMPLGRALVQSGRINRGIVVHALRQQTLVRLGQLSLEKAVESIREYSRSQQHLP